jgi:hypothetical protein
VVTYLLTYQQPNGIAKDTSTLSITVNRVNDDFIDNDEIMSIDQNKPLTGNVIDGSSVDGPITVAAFSIDTNNDGILQFEEQFLPDQLVNINGVGSLQINHNGNYRFTPDANYSGPVPLVTYDLDDTFGPEETSTLRITVNPASSNLTDDSETVSVNEDGSLTGNVLSNTRNANGLVTVTNFTVDTNNDGIPESFAANQTATITGVGTLRIKTDGTYTFTPVANYNGPVPQVTYSLTDGSGPTVSSTLTVNVTPVNDAPTTAPVTLTAIAEDSGARLITQAELLANATDVDGDPLMATGLTIETGKGTLVDNGNGTWRYTPVLDDDTAVSFSYTISDGKGGSVTGSANLDITPVNDPPAGIDAIVTLLPNGIKTFAGSDFVFSDIDGDNLAQVKISSLPANGTLKYDGVAITQEQVTAGFEVSAANLGLLTFVPDMNTSGSPYTSFTFQVRDDGGTANGGIDLDPTPNRISINVLDVPKVSNAPAGRDTTVTILEDGVKKFQASDFGFSDIDGNSLSAIKINSLPANGTLKYDGVAITQEQVTAGFEVLAGIPGVQDLYLGLLTFVPAANANGNNYASFSFQVRDNGGTANGGIDLDPTPNTITFNVTTVNDAPAGTDAMVTMLEDSVKTFTTSDFGFSDVDGNSLAAVKISSLPTNGTLRYNGTALTQTQVTTGFEVATANLGLLAFSPVANAYGNSYAAFNFQVRDDGGTANGGVDLDQSPNTLTFNVTPVNDDFTDADEVVGISQGTIRTGNVIDGSGVDGPITVTTFSVAGIAIPYSAGQTATINGVGTLLINPNGNYTFTPLATYSGSVPVVTYTLTDGLGPNDTSTLSIVVAPAFVPSYDFGDAPSSYGTLLANNGARHVVTANPTLYFGSRVDAETDGQPNQCAAGDDLNGLDDEDGIWSTEAVVGRSMTVSMQVIGAGSFINAWLDFNGNGLFDTNEQILKDYAAVQGTNTVTVNIPVDAKIGKTFARFRLSTDKGLAPTGLASNGEVEDYSLVIKSLAQAINLGPAANSLGIGIFALGNGTAGGGSMTGNGPNTRWGVASSVNMKDPVSISNETDTSFNLAAGPGVNIAVSDGTIWKDAQFYTHNDGPGGFPETQGSPNGFSRFDGNSVIPNSKGTVVATPTDLTAARQAVINASTQIDALVANETLTNLASGYSKNIQNSIDEVYVIRVTNDFNGGVITLTGDVNDKFIFDIDNQNGGLGVDFKSGEVKLVGVDAADVLWNVNGTGGRVFNLQNPGGSAFRGTVLAVQGDAKIDGGFSGGVYARSINMMSNILSIGKVFQPISSSCPGDLTKVPVSLGEAATYGILALNNGTLSINSATVFIGDIGYSRDVVSTTNQKIGEGYLGEWTGEAYVHSQVSNFQYSAKDYIPSGGRVTNSIQDARLDAANIAALQASTTISQLTPTNIVRAINDANLSLGAIDGKQTINVVQLASLNMNSDVLELKGDASDYFLINVLGDFQFSQSEVRLTGGLTADHVIFNFPNASTINLNKSSNIFNGTILAPKLNTNLIYHNPAQFNGAIIANRISVHSDFNLNHVGFNSPLLAIGGTGV